MTVSGSGIARVIGSPLGGFPSLCKSTVLEEITVRVIIRFPLFLFRFPLFLFRFFLLHKDMEALSMLSVMGFGLRILGE